MKIFNSLLIISLTMFVSNEAFSNEIKELVCDEELILAIDENNMTESEILKAKEDHFNQLLAQQDEDCISNKLGSSQLDSSSASKGGQVEGTEISAVKTLSSIGQTLSTPELIDIASTSNSQPPLNNGVIKCLEKYTNDDEFSVQLKEAISKTNDPALKKELLNRYAKYNNIKPENFKC
jgi:hypothetical protein